MMKKLIALTLATLMGACAGTNTGSSGCDVPRHEPIETPKPTVVSGKTWSVVLPPRWNVKITPKDAVTKDNVTVELLATSDVKFGSLPIMVGLATIDLTKGDIADEDFGSKYVLGLFKEPSVEVYNAKHITLDGRPGTIAYFVRESKIGTIQVAVGANKKGHLLRCTGDNSKIREIVIPCSLVFKTFSVD